jgi:hypothetical protein
MNALKKWLLSVMVFSLTACATNIGNGGLDGATEASINSWIIDGKTTKAAVNEKMGPYENAPTPSLGRAISCTPEKKFCIYSYFGDFTKYRDVSIYYDENNVVKSHTVSID